MRPRRLPLALGARKRTIAVCHVWPRANLNAYMVHHGYALAYRRYSDSYISNERTAERDQAGIWSGAFVTPWEWRRRRSLEKLRDRLERGRKAVGRVEI